MIKFKKNIRIAVCAAYCLISVFYLSVVSQAAVRSEPLIRVGLYTGQFNILVSVDAPFELLSDDGKVIAKFNANEKVALSDRGKKIAINGSFSNETYLRIVADENHPIEVNRRKYRGDIAIFNSYGKTGLTAVNTLPLEQYVSGILTKEVSPEWPVEAVKAQAVAARTYAIYNLNKHQTDGFDVCSLTDCQVYGGIESEDARTTKAAEVTRGVIMTYQGKPIPAYFHSSGGGYTENSENVWSNSLPFLKGVVDYDQKSPRYKWEKVFTASELEARFANAGFNLGNLQTFELSKLSIPPVQSADRGVSGRLKTLRISGTRDAIALPGTKVRSLLDLPSTLFDIRIALATKDTLEFDITDSYGDHETKKVDINASPLPEKGFVTDKTSIRRITGRPNERIVFSGFGYGHGIGMSQWGAKAMAEAAPAGETEYFKTILKHYYQGVEISKIY